MEPHLIDFADFFRDARIGSVRLGAGGEEMVRVFGPPTYWEGFDRIPHTESEIWCYDSLQLNFGRKNKITTFMINYTDVYGCDVSFGPISFGDTVPKPSTSISEFEDYLVRSGISFRRGILNRVGHPVVESKSGVFAAFTQGIIDFESDLPVYSEIETIYKLRVDLDDDFWKIESDSHYSCGEENAAMPNRR